MKKMRRTSSYLSIDNLGDDEDEDEEEKESDGEKKEINKEDIIINPVLVLERAFEKVKAVGSATALIGIKNKKEINLANLGDSGFLLIRFKNGEAYTAAKSKEQ